MPFFIIKAYQTPQNRSSINQFMFRFCKMQEGKVISTINITGSWLVLTLSQTLSSVTPVTPNRETALFSTSMTPPF